MRIDRVVALLGLAACAVHAALARAGDLREQPVVLALGVSASTVLMVAAWRAVRSRPAAVPTAIAVALLLRLIAAFGQPALSDDVYRYVWDGRVQNAGVHPYRFAPTAPELAELRDSDWERINHPSVKTIYPPLSQMMFAVLAAAGCGPTGFRAVLGGLDWAAVLALGHVLRKRSLPLDRVVLYAWHPLAVLETAGSGHVEPFGVVLLTVGAAWIIGRRYSLSMTALGGAVMVKLFPVVFIPAFLKRTGFFGLAALVAALAVPIVPYAVLGPAWGGGTVDFAERWERNSVAFSALASGFEAAGVERPLKAAVAAAQTRVEAPAAVWDWLYARVWPGQVARGVVALVAAIWILWVARRPALPLERELLWVAGGVLLLSPTLHPWYLLWVLPWAAVALSPGWLVLSVTVFLSYLSTGDVSWPLRALEYAPALVVAVVACRR